jgi:hypothetical protein
LNKTTEKNNAQLDREIALLEARGDQIGVFNKQRQKLENELAQARANYGKNNEKEWGKIILDTKNALQVLQITEQNYNRDQANARNEANKKRLEDQKKHEQEVIDAAYEIRKKGLTQQEAQVKFSVDTSLKLQEGLFRKQYTDSEKLRLFVQANQEELIKSTIGYFNTISELADAFAGRDEESQRRAYEICFNYIVNN